MADEVQLVQGRVDCAGKTALDLYEHTVIEVCVRALAGTALGSHRSPQPSPQRGSAGHEDVDNDVLSRCLRIVQTAIVPQPGPVGGETNWHVFQTRKSAVPLSGCIRSLNHGALATERGTEAAGCLVESMTGAIQSVPWCHSLPLQATRALPRACWPIIAHRGCSLLRLHRLPECGNFLFGSRRRSQQPALLPLPVPVLPTLAAMDFMLMPSTTRWTVGRVRPLRCGAEPPSGRVRHIGCEEGLSRSPGASRRWQERTLPPSVSIVACSAGGLVGLTAAVTTQSPALSGTSPTRMAARASPPRRGTCCYGR